MRADLWRPRHPNIVDGLANLGSVLSALGNFDAARKVLQEALEMDIEVRGKNHPYIANDHARLGRLAYSLRDFKSAAASFRTALEIYEYNVGAGQLPKTHAYIAEARAWLARTLVEHGNPAAEDARDHALVALSTWALEFGERSVEYAITNAVLGRSLYLLDDSSEEARERLGKAYPIVFAARGADSAVAQLILGWLRQAGGTGSHCT
jgi:tetratricopeptide (TPR) repeat protein